MKTFLLDIWLDLREKRLWPVAVLLAAGLVAVPLVLAKPKSAPKATSASAERAPSLAGRRALDSFKVQLADDQSGAGSTLDLFDPKDPFKPPKSVLEALAAAKTSAAGSTATASSSSSSSPSGSGSSDTGSTGTGTGGTGGSGSGGSPGGGSPGPGEVTRYTYVVDVSFGRNGRERRYRGLGRLDMLPSQNSPLLISLGVDARASNAVFLVDSTLTAAGEGRCPPSGPECAVLYLGAGSEEYFTDEDGNSYTLRIDEIRRVKLESAASASRSHARRARPSKAAADRRRFVPPILIDLVTVASPDAAASRTRTDRR